MNGSDPKQIARELLEEAHPALVGLSHWIHANPELGYQEVLAAGWVTEWLTTAGFEVRTGMAGMPTAIVGSYGPGPFHVAICAEYDALPAVGHACGHNVIAAAGIGAGLALAAVAEELGLRVTVMGTPAEETGGGKVGLIKAGEFDGVHAAMMVHPWPQDEATPTIIAIRSLNVTYTGREAHAAGFPYLGVNAADALVVAQTAIALLRQQLRSTDRVHGIVTKGGDAPNIIPARTQAQWMVRGPDLERLDEVTTLVRRCFEAGALATGATLELEEEICYADVRHDPDLARLYQANAEQLGRVFSDPGMPVSTDMGNVSYVVPTIHPMIGIEAGGAVNHQAAFAAACATPSADRAIFDGALAMAWTAIDVAVDEALRSRLMQAQPVSREVALVSAAWTMPAVPAVAPVAPASPPAAQAGESASGVTQDGTADAFPEGAARDVDLLIPASDGATPADLIEQPIPGGTWFAVDESPEPQEPPPAALGAPAVEPSGSVAPADLAAPATPAATSVEPPSGVAPAAMAALAMEPPPGATPAATAVEPPSGVAPPVPVARSGLAVSAATAPSPWARVLSPDAPSAPVAPALSRRDWDAAAWDQAFEQAGAQVGWEEQFEAAIRERMVGEGMDRSEAIADLASDLQEAAQARAAAGEATPQAAPASVLAAGSARPAGWPPQAPEQVSREQIEAEGFSFIAPDVSSHADDLGDAWSRNGKDHAGDDLPSR